MAVVHDPDYYICDGNVVVQVESTLFKVHRSNLRRDGSAFHTMFDLGQETPHSGGGSDEDPIILSGDSVAEFHALMWSLYALPPEFASPSVGTNILRLTNLARIAHKYQFETLENWALGTLCRSYPPTMENLFRSYPPTLSSSTSPTLEEVTEVAALCKHHLLSRRLTSTWYSLLDQGRDVAIAMRVSERLDFQDLMGRAYYTMMLKGRAAWNDDPDLTYEQRVRLLSGFYNISHLWEIFPLDLPSKTIAPLPLHDKRCQEGGTRRLYCDEYWCTFITKKDFLSSLVHEWCQKHGKVAPKFPDVLGLGAYAELSLGPTSFGAEFQATGDGWAPQCCLKVGAAVAMSKKVEQIRSDLSSFFMSAI
ncbi:hypothetical protein PLICRDRAFT_699924 [Plicaturopsis crispa FD-325 SS-3]|nr:hypothetical protein PLICRDRAFT_699924 [Plicaturopsis crispa FD-325 SS-3]